MITAINPSNIEQFLHKDKLSIFLLHGVIKKQEYSVRNYTKKHIEADLFDRYMAVLSVYGNALTMEKVLEHLTTKEPFPVNSFAITFDDGFENNISVAAPILEKYEIPAMIYLTTDFIQNNKMSWIDRIEYAVEFSQLRELKFGLNNFIYSLADNPNKINFLSAVRDFVKKTPDCQPNMFADQICEQLGVEGVHSTDDPLDKKLSWAKIKELNQKKGILSFGGHSHTHPILSFLSPEELKYELDTSISLLWKMGGVESTHYSYPEGLAHCFSGEVVRELKSRMVRCCPTAIYGVNTVDVDPFELMRIMIA